MPIESDFLLQRDENGNIIITLDTPAPIGGEYLRFQMSKRFGSASGIYSAYSNSGMDGVSGLTITNSGQGKVQIAFEPSHVSGLNAGNYACKLQRLSSGRWTKIWEGFRVMDV